MKLPMIPPHERSRQARRFAGQEHTASPSASADASLDSTLPHRNTFSLNLVFLGVTRNLLDIGVSFRHPRPDAIPTFSTSLTKHELRHEPRMIVGELNCQAIALTRADAKWA